MFGCWKSLTHKQKIALIVAIIGAIGGVSIAFNVNISTGDSTTQTTNGGDAYIHQGNGDINTGDTHIQNQTIHTGIRLDEHEQRLKSREAEVRAELEHAHAADRQVLEVELSTIEKQLQNSQASHELRITSLKEQIAQLEQKRGEFPDAMLEQAIKALQQGNSEKAAHIFQQIEEEGEGHFRRVAEAAFQRGKIAQDAIRFTDALKHYEKAVRLQPDNILYLNQLGNLYFRLDELAQAEKVYLEVLKLVGSGKKVIR
jgi:tetratricopeptide (TPR) repeat protein